MLPHIVFTCALASLLLTDVLSARLVQSVLRDYMKRVNYVPITDKEAVEAFQLLTAVEGIIPALESAHALAQVIKLAPTMGKDEIIVMCLSGRGDKDVETVGRMLGMIE